MIHRNFLTFEVWMIHFPEEGLYEHTFLNQILTLYGTSDVTKYCCILALFDLRELK
jgi:hypothetical protein